MKKIYIKIGLIVLAILFLALLAFFLFPLFSPKKVSSLDVYSMNIMYYDGEKDIDISASYSKDAGYTILTDNIEEGNQPYRSNNINVDIYALLKNNLSDRELLKNKVEKNLTMSAIWNLNTELLQIIPNSSQELACEFQNSQGTIMLLECKNEKEELIVEIY